MNHNMAIYPEYERSPVAIASSILRYFGIDWPYPSLNILDAAFEKKPKHVALVVFDGMGIAQIEKYLDEKSFLRTHCLCSISSVLSSHNRCGDEQLLFRSAARATWLARLVALFQGIRQGHRCFFPALTASPNRK